MSWRAPRDELGDRREPVELGNSVGSDVDAALTFKAGHGRVVNEPLDRAARERGARCGRRTPARESLARKPIRGKPFTRGILRGEFHWDRGLSGVTLACLRAMAAITPWYCAIRRPRQLRTEPRCQPAARRRIRRQDIQECEACRHESYAGALSWCRAWRAST